MNIKIPLDAHSLHLLKLLKSAHDDFLLVGAMAREILLRHVYGQATGRATADMDLAITVENWAAYQSVRSRLITAGFQSTIIDHKLTYRIVPEYGDAWDYKVDLIPYGGVEDQHQRISWPPDFTVIMNLAGYREANQHAVAVTLAPGLTIRVCSLPSLATLKLLAWNDRNDQTPRDAEDLLLIMQSYAATQIPDRIFESQYAAALESLGWNPDDMWVWTLGHDMRQQTTPQTASQLADLLQHDRKRQRLIQHMDPTRIKEDRMNHLIDLLLSGITTA